MQRILFVFSQQTQEGRCNQTNRTHLWSPKELFIEQSDRLLTVHEYRSNNDSYPVEEKHSCNIGSCALNNLLPQLRCQCPSHDANPARREAGSSQKVVQSCWKFVRPSRRQEASTNRVSRVIQYIKYCNTDLRSASDPKSPKTIDG